MIRLITLDFYNDSTATLDSVGFTNLSQEVLLSTTYKSFELKPYAKVDYMTYNLGFGKQSETAYRLGVYANGFNNKFKSHLAIKKRGDLASTGIEFNGHLAPLKFISFNVYYDEKAPDLFHLKYASNHFRWDNSFKRETHTRLDANLKVLKNTTLKAFYHRVDGYIYLNENAIASQTISDHSTQGLELNSMIKKGKFTFSNQFLVQNTTGEYLQLPSFIGRIKLAYKNKMLGEALVQPGIQLNYSSAFYAPKYMAPLSSFYYQNTDKVGGAVLLDVFVNVKVANFTFYGVFKNILQNQMLNENFASPNYVGPVQRFNFGLRWNFYDK